MAAKKKKPVFEFPMPPRIERMWDGSNESVKSYGGRNWKVRDLRALVKDEPVFELPLSLIPLCEHSFPCPDLIEFANHMKHVMDADLEDPLIMDDRGWVVDGRHRIVKALLEGRYSLPCKRVPLGATPSSYE